MNTNTVRLDDTLNTLLLVAVAAIIVVANFGHLIGVAEAPSAQAVAAPAAASAPTQVAAAPVASRALVVR